VLARASWLAASLCLALPVWSVLFTPHAPLQVKGVVALLLAIAAAWPLAGVLVLAGLGPLAVPLGLAWGQAPFEGNAMLEAMVLAVLTGVAARWSIAGAPTGGRLFAASLVFGSVVACSALTLLGVQQGIAEPLPAFLSALWTHAVRDYFSHPLQFPAWHEAATWLEALLLALVIERLLRQSPRAGAGLALVAACGLVAESAFSLLRLGEIWARRPDISLWQDIWSSRISPHFQDVNAIGSLFALGTVCWLTVALRARIPGWARAGAIAGTLIVGAALWLTGSRAALGAAGLTGLLLWNRLRRPTLNTVTAILVAAALAVTFISPDLLRPPGRASVASAVNIRLDLAGVGIEMTRDHPWFGVGLGEFRRHSTNYVSPSLIARFPKAMVGENAHNQWIQIMGELGLVGLAAFAWYWTRLLWPAMRRQRSGDAVPWLTAWAAGLGAFHLSALFGHPFLTPYVVLCVFIGVGIVAGLTPESPPPQNRRLWSRWLPSIIGLVLVASVPFRVNAAIGVPGRVIGASAVVGELDGIRYRIAGPSATWFVPASATILGLPLRASAEATGPCIVRLRINGRPVNEVVVDAAAWRPVRIEVASIQAEGAHRIDIEPAGAGCILLVGQIEARQ
jgi:O-antigen ligase